MAGDLHVSDRWRRWRQQVDLDEYDSRWDRMAAAGASVDDEAELVCRLGGERILDAGCGTGRLAVELARRGRSVVGVDNDVDMLDRARARSEHVSWVLADLATMELPAAFDLVVMAGDVLHYVRPGDESMVVSNLARHLKPGGHLVSGASLAEPVQLTHYDNWCRAAGLAAVERYASWSQAPYDRPGHYAVSIHQRPAAPTRAGRRR